MHFLCLRQCGGREEKVKDMVLLTTTKYRPQYKEALLLISSLSDNLPNPCNISCVCEIVSVVDAVES